MGVQRLLDGLVGEVPYVPLGEVADLQRGTAITKKSVVSGDIPVIAGGREPAYTIDRSNRTGETVVVAGSGAYAGFVSYWNEPIFVSDAFSIKPYEGLLPRFVFHVLSSKQDELHAMKSGGGVPHVYAKDVARVVVPVPPLGVQREIVQILDRFTKLEMDLESALEAELEARHKQWAYYLKQIVDHSQRELVKYSLGEIEGAGYIFMGRGKVISKVDIKRTPGDYPVYSSSGVGSGELGRYGNYMFDDERITWSVDGGGRFFYRAPHKYSVTNVSGWMTTDDKILRTRYLYYVLYYQWLDEKFDYTRKAHPSVIRDVYSLGIPPLDVQDQAVQELDQFDFLTSSLTSGLPAEIVARRRQYEYYRDRLLSFGRVA